MEKSAAYESALHAEIDSAYGSPKQYYGANPQLLTPTESLQDAPGSLDDKWRFEIFPQDAQVNYEMFKPHVQERLILSCSIDSQSTAMLSPYSCSPKDVFLLSPSEHFSNLNLDYHFEEPENDHMFIMSPTINKPSMDQSLPYIAPVRHISSPKKEGKDPTKLFTCSMCTSTFSRNHDLKRHQRF